MPLEMENYGCYNKGKKKRLSISFSFSYLSLFVDTPGLSGQQSRGSPCPEAGQPVRAWLLCKRCSSWVPLGIVTSIYTALKYCIAPIRRGLGDPRGTASRAGARVYPLVGFFGIFLAETRKIPAGGNYINELRNNESKLEAPKICPTIFLLKNTV